MSSFSLALKLLTMTINKANEILRRKTYQECPSSHFTPKMPIMSEFKLTCILSMNVATNEALVFGVPSKLSFSPGVAVM
uniref:Uncharacterized protein n=1 Tax=Lepeophtheirus salmonis TaxID=72036 RepID=A0A0K2UWK3_LEPSM